MWLATIGPVFLALCASVVWLISLKGTDIQRMTDLGLISVLPPLAFIALALLTISFCLALRQQPLRVPVLLLHLTALVFMLYGITALVEETPRFAVAWLHVGFTEYVMRTGHVDPTLDARFSWPGFFILSAFVTQITGLQDTTPFLMWAPVFFSLLYLGPLLMILSSATNDKRLVWLGVWFFYLLNWIGQDYFAPQAFNYFLFLVVVGILLKWFKAATRQPDSLAPRWQGFGILSRLLNIAYHWSTPVDVPNTASSSGQRAGLLAIVVILFATIVSSHQLTPFFLLAAVALLVVFKRISLQGLPVLMAVILLSWLSYMTVVFLAGHLYMITGDFGQVGATVNANVTGRIQGSLEHRIVIYMRLLLTLVTWGLAFLGGLRRVRKGHRDLTLALLAITPFPFWAFQSYGGELLLRVYLFALPFMAFFIAALFYTTPILGKSWRTTGVIGLTSVALLGGFLITRYGNERMDYFTSNEVDAVKYLYSIAEPGSLLVASSYNLPWKFRDYEKYDYMPVKDEVLVGDVDAIAHLMKNKNYAHSYFILSRSQKAYAQLFYGVPYLAWERFVDNVAKSNRFRVIYANEDAIIFALANDDHGGNK